jgi:hypothetical protein
MSKYSPLKIDMEEERSMRSKKTHALLAKFDKSLADKLLPVNVKV